MNNEEYKVLIGGLVIISFAVFILLIIISLSQQSIPYKSIEHVYVEVTCEGHKIRKGYVHPELETPTEFIIINLNSYSFPKKLCAYKIISTFWE